jgi:hypothetical protein
VGGLDVHLAEHIANGGDQVPYIRAAVGEEGRSGGSGAAGLPRLAQ